MKSECLPFSQIPHTTPLFSDFLSAHSKVQQFYPRSAYFNQWMRDEAAAIRYDAARRERVATILLRQNESWGGSSKNIGEHSPPSGGRDSRCHRPAGGVVWRSAIFDFQSPHRRQTGGGRHSKGEWTVCRFSGWRPKITTWKK